MSYLTTSEIVDEKDSEAYEQPIIYGYFDNLNSIGPVYDGPIYDLPFYSPNYYGSDYDSSFNDGPVYNNPNYNDPLYDDPFYNAPNYYGHTSDGQRAIYDGQCFIDSANRIWQAELDAGIYINSNNVEPEMCFNFCRDTG